MRKTETKNADGRRVHYRHHVIVQNYFTRFHVHSRSNQMLSDNDERQLHNLLAERILSKSKRFAYTLDRSTDRQAKRRQIKKFHLSICPTQRFRDI